jgi:uncharacterized protein
VLPLDVQGESLVLLPDRAVYWPTRGTLMVADLHLGKATAFAAAGVPVPETTHRTLARLSSLLNVTCAERLIVLGDLIHARAGRTDATLDLVSAWRRSHTELAIMLVRGNHDVRAGDPPDEWMIGSVDAPWIESPFSMCHTPEECEGLARKETNAQLYGWCGHIHPVHVLHDGGGSSVRASCLWMTKTHAVLPAFGDFTGGHRVRPKRGDRVFLYGESQIIEVPCV